MNWKETKYSKIYRVLTRYYLSKDPKYRYHISIFSLVHRAVESPDYIKEEVKKLNGQVIDNNQALVEAKNQRDSQAVEILQSERERLLGQIRIFKDLVTIHRQLLKSGLKANYNEIFSVLRDVELAFMR